MTTSAAPASAWMSPPSERSTPPQPGAGRGGGSQEGSVVNLHGPNNTAQLRHLDPVGEETAQLFRSLLCVCCQIKTNELTCLSGTRLSFHLHDRYFSFDIKAKTLKTWLCKLLISSPGCSRNTMRTTSERLNCARAARGRHRPRLPFSPKRHLVDDSDLGCS